MKFIRFLLPLLSAPASAIFAQEADIIYHNGSILTMSGKEPDYVVALAVNRISRDGAEIGIDQCVSPFEGQKIEAKKPLTMKFAKGKLAIFGGINRLSGSYAIVHDKLTMGEIISTRMAGPPELMELENRFAKALRSVVAFHVHGNELELLSDGTVVATFRTAE